VAADKINNPTLGRRARSTTLFRPVGRRASGRPWSLPVSIEPAQADGAPPAATSAGACQAVGAEATGPEQFLLAAFAGELERICRT
jgi:hypothetical protein